MNQQQNGFTMAEVLAALFILSLATLALAEITQGAVIYWERTESVTLVSTQNRELLEHIESAEIHLRQENWTQTGPKLEIDNGQDLFLSSPKITHSPDCIYDLVGRRCR